jgi:hypothetical protein
MGKENGSQKVAITTVTPDTYRFRTAKGNVLFKKVRVWD